MIDRASKEIPINLFYHTIIDKKGTTVNVLFFATATVIVVTAAVTLITSLVLFVSGDVVASIAADVIFLVVAIDFF